MRPIAELGDDFYFKNMYTIISIYPEWRTLKNITEIERLEAKQPR